MSVITAIHDRNEKITWLGSNGRATIGSFVGPSLDRKWIGFGDWLIGMTGSGPKDEALRASAEQFPHDAGHPFEILKFMRAAYSAFDIGEVDEGLKRFCGSGLIIHKSGAVWDFDSSLCLTAVPPGAFWARGSGMDAAIGAGRALRDYAASPKELTRRVIEIVTELDVDSPGEVLVQTFNADGELSEPLNV